MEGRGTSRRISSVLAVVLFFSCLQGSWSQLFFVPDVFSTVYDEGLNMEEWANWSFDFKGAGGFFFVNFHSFKSFQGPFGIDICLGGFDGFKLAFMDGTFTFDDGFLQFSILDEGHFIPENTKLDLFNTPYFFTEPGPLLESPETFVWTTYQVPLGITDGNFFQFYNQGHPTNCFVLDELIIFENGPAMPPSPPPPPPAPPTETIVLDAADAPEIPALQPGFTAKAYSANNGFPNGLDNDGGLVTLGPFGILNIFRTNFHELAIGPANITILIDPATPEDLEDLPESTPVIVDNLDVSVSLFNFSPHPPSTILTTAFLSSPPQSISFLIINPGFGIDGIQIKSETSFLGVQRFRLRLIVVYEDPGAN